MATEYPPLGKSYVLSYSNDDKNFPIIAIKKDPRVDNYRRPDDLSPHPDPSRYPNHRFTSTQPTNTDERVIWIYEILPAPYVPFTRYDDDLGPVQGRRRFVVNSGQEASLERDKKVSYEAREGSAIVSSEIEETWDAGSIDPDLESPFPIKDRDFYDPSRGPVQERRQLVSTTGDEVASLENNNGVITQISYEAYNEYLSFKVVQTYNVNGPQLVGFATNNQGQLTTVTTQRKGSDNYDAPQPTATRTVESSREDAESIVERVIDVSEVFDNKTVSSSKPDVLPERFRASVPTETTQETIEQTSVEIPSLEDGDLERSEERVGQFTVRKSAVSRNVNEIPDLDGVDYEESFDVQIPYTEKISTTIPAGSAEATPLDDTRYLVREYDKDNIETYLENFLQTYPTTINMDLPRVLQSISVEWDEKSQTGYYNNDPIAGGLLYQFSNTDKGEASTQSAATPLVSLNFQDVWSKNIPATIFIFFLKNPVTESEILSKTGSSKWPTFRPKSHVITGKGIDLRASVSVTASVSIQQPKPSEFGGYTDESQQKDYSRSVTPIIVNIPQCLHGPIVLNETKTVTATITAKAKTATYGTITALTSTETATITDTAFIKGPSLLYPTSPMAIPTTGKYLIDSNVDFFKYGFSIVRATVIDAAVFA
jgi:hypothetical protein